MVAKILTKPKSKIALGALLVGLIIIFSLGGYVAYAKCRNTNDGMSAMHIEEVSLVDDLGKIVNIQSHIADDGMERSFGYQYICGETINQTTILFAYQSPIDGQFHMRNVKAPLDIGFFDSDGMLIKAMIMDTYDDGNNRFYYPGQPFQFALEARIGFYDDNNLSAGKALLVIQSVNDGG